MGSPGWTTTAADARSRNRGCAPGLGRRLRRGPEPLADCGRRTGAGAGVTAREVGLPPCHRAPFSSMRGPEGTRCRQKATATSDVASRHREMASRSCAAQEREGNPRPPLNGVRPPTEGHGPSITTLSGEDVLVRSRVPTSCVFPFPYFSRAFPKRSTPRSEACRHITVGIRQKGTGGRSDVFVG